MGEAHHLKCAYNSAPYHIITASRVSRRSPLPGLAHRYLVGGAPPDSYPRYGNKRVQSNVCSPLPLIRAELLDKDSRVVGNT